MSLSILISCFLDCLGIPDSHDASRASLFDTESVSHRTQVCPLPLACCTCLTVSLERLLKSIPADSRNSPLARQHCQPPSVKSSVCVPRWLAPFPTVEPAAWALSFQESQEWEVAGGGDASGGDILFI